jgi:hypothetical protein
MLEPQKLAFLISYSYCSSTKRSRIRVTFTTGQPNWCMHSHSRGRPSATTSKGNIKMRPRPGIFPVGYNTAAASTSPCTKAQRPAPHSPDYHTFHKREIVKAHNPLLCQEHFLPCYHCTTYILVEQPTRAIALVSGQPNLDNGQTNQHVGLMPCLTSLLAV